MSKSEPKPDRSEPKAPKPHRQFPGQHEGEEVQLVFHQHPIVMRKALIFGMVGILAAIMPLYIWSSTSLLNTYPNFYGTGFQLFGLGFLVILAAWFYRWIGWYYTVYIVTNERIVEIKQRGFFNRRVSEFGLDKVQNVNYSIRGFQAVVFQFGDIIAQTYVGDLIMSTIHKPVHIHEQIIEIIREFNSSTPSSN